MGSQTVSVPDLTSFYHGNRLGNLYLPNGDRRTVDMNILYSLIENLATRYGSSFDCVLSIIAFGSSVMFPGFKDAIHTSRKYWLFGPARVANRRIPIRPNDFDFFIITRNSLKYSGAWMKKGRIHLINRGVDQLFESVRARDSVTLCALEKGVPIFFDDRYKNILAGTGIKPATPRKVFWDFNEQGKLDGFVN